MVKLCPNILRWAMTKRYEKRQILLSSLHISLSCRLYLLPRSLFPRYHTTAYKWCLSVTKTARVLNRKFAKIREQGYHLLVDITLTGFQQKYNTLTSSSPSGNVASLRSLLGNRCITFPFTSSKIQQRKPGLITNSEISRGVRCLHTNHLCKTGC